MSSSEATNSPQVNLMLSLAEAFKQGDVDFIAKLLHKDHHYLIYPRSLGRREQTKEEFLQRTREVTALLTDSDASCSSV